MDTWCSVPTDAIRLHKIDIDVYNTFAYMCTVAVSDWLPGTVATDRNPDVTTAADARITRWSRDILTLIVRTVLVRFVRDAGNSSDDLWPD